MDFLRTYVVVVALRTFGKGNMLCIDTELEIWKT